MHVKHMLWGRARWEQRKSRFDEFTRHKPCQHGRSKSFMLYSTSQKWWCLFGIKHTFLRLFDSAHSSMRSLLTWQRRDRKTVTPNRVSNLHTSGVWLLESNVFRAICGNALVRFSWLSLSPFICIQIILLIMCSWYAVACYYILSPVVRCFKFSVLVCSYCRRRFFGWIGERVKASCVRSALVDLNSTIAHMCAFSTW